MNRVAVTGMGIIDTLGANPTECFESMLDTYYSHPPLFNHSRLERHRQQPVYAVDKSKLILPELKPAVLNNLEPCNLFALHTIEQALKQSGVAHSENVGVVGSSITSGNYFAMDTWPPILSEKGRVRPKQLLNAAKDYMSGFISQYYGYKGLNTCIQAACATSLFSIDYAMRYVDDYDYVVCVISEHGVNEADISFSRQLGAMGTKSCPFDDDRDGFIMGEGAGAFILESEEKAKKRNANIIAYLYTPGFASDTESFTSPDLDGSAAKMSMRNAPLYAARIVVDQ